MKKLFILSLFLFSQILFASNLKWAADTSSGAPFAFSDPKDPGKIIGFEVDVVNAIAKEMKVQPEFVQNSWDGLILGLLRGNYDIAINGIEITEDRKAEVFFSEPYYVTYEQLTVRKETENIFNLADCKGKKVGTLKFSLAERILQAEGGIEILTYEDEVNAYSDLENERIDAVLIDAPIALFYALPNPKLKNVGAPVGQMSYGIAINKNNPDLLLKVNQAIRKIAESGELREIMDRWNMWNPLMAAQFQDDKPSQVPPSSYDYFVESTGHGRTFMNKLKLYVEFMPLFLKGAATTMGVSVVSMMLAMVLGLILTIMRLYGALPLQWLSIVYIEVIRGTPLLIQLLFIFYGLPYLGIKLSPFVAGFLGLGLNYAAYESENYRAGIGSVPKQQTDAAFALGMNQRQTLRYVILPQALRNVIPPVTNDFISLLKDSSLVSAITMIELTKVYGKIATTYYDYFGTGIIVAGIYLLLGLPFVRLARYYERKLKNELKLPHLNGHKSSNSRLKIS
jgi:polar amino acid transport system substrate-binding protein